MAFDRKELWKTAATLGAALLLAGLIRYSAQGELDRWTTVILIVAGALLLASFAFNVRAVLSIFARRSTKLGANTLTLSLAVLAILVFLNYLGTRHPKRFDFSSDQLFTLSDQTHKIVSGLKQDVKVILFAKTANDELRDRMAEYEALSRHISYQVVDPEEHPELAKQYGVARMGQVVVASGTRIEHPEESQEQDLTNAILKVTRTTVKAICFVEGHGEKSIADSSGDGYSAVNDVLKGDNYQTKSVNLVTADQVPQDCSVLVEAGPQKPLFPQEAQMIQKYLDGGGKVMILVDPDIDSKLDDLFAEWNIKVGDNTVIDVSGVGRLIGRGPAAPLVMEYGDHPITRTFARKMTFFPIARTVNIADSSKTSPQATELLKTSSASFTTPKITGDTVSYNAKTDTKGPLSLGVAAEKKEGNQDSRLVVIGNSGFAANKALGSAFNADLFADAVNWLAQDEDMISLRPKSPTNRRVTLTEAQQRELYWFSIVILPGIVILTGIYIWWKRR